jgi:Ser/Thr protein kinase RdoA (MazF antagonist)
MTTLAEAVRAEQSTYGDAPAVVHQAIHGTDDPEEVASQLQEAVRSMLGARVVEARFHRASVGSVTGVVLDSGRAVVVKAYQSRWTESFLADVARAQTALADAGIPCARPLAGPGPLAHGWVSIESWLDDPGSPARLGASERAASAGGLAAVIAAAPMLEGLERPPLATAEGSLYPEPHSPLFDFAATAVGAEWIDELARTVKPRLAGGRLVVAHTDWSARNIRLSADGVRAVYDLDSLAVVTLPVAVGLAAATWRAFGEAGDGLAPGVDEVGDWLDAYPSSLSAEERRGAFAAALWSHVYAARCEHAVDPEERLLRRTRPVLRAEAERFLLRSQP